MLDNSIDRGEYNILGIPTHIWRGRVRLFLQSYLNDILNIGVKFNLYPMVTAECADWIIYDNSYSICYYGSFSEYKKMDKKFMNKITNVIRKLFRGRKNSVRVEFSGIYTAFTTFNIYFDIDDFVFICDYINRLKNSDLHIKRGGKYFNGIRRHFKLDYLSRGMSRYVSNSLADINSAFFDYMSKMYDYSEYGIYLDYIDEQYVLYIVFFDKDMSLDGVYGLFNQYLDFEFIEKDDYKYLKAINQEQLKAFIGLMRIEGRV